MKKLNMKPKDKPPGSDAFELPKTVGIIYSDVKREYFPTEAQYITEKDAEKDARLVSLYLEKMGIKPLLFPGNDDLPAALKKAKPDMVINLVDSVKGSEYLSSSIPGVLELLEVPYTGGEILGISLTMNKFLVKKFLQQNGIPTPAYQLVDSAGDYLDPTLRYPLISKLNEIHGGVEITQDAVSETEKHLRERLKFLIQTYKQSVLIEEFIVGREITAILLEGLNKKVYLAEKVFTKAKEKYVFVTYEDQWLGQAPHSYYYEKYEDPILKEYVKKAFEVTKMYDYGKFDIRVDQSGRYFFIDANCNPAFGPKESDTAISTILDLHGITFIEILRRLLINTMRDQAGKERLPIS